MHRVFPIDGHKIDQRSELVVDQEASYVKDRARVADEIAQTYDQVEEDGGEIVDSHVIPGERLGSATPPTRYVLYLVAKFAKEA